MKTNINKKARGPMINRINGALVILSLFLTLTAFSSALEDASGSNSAPAANNVSIADDNGGTPVVGATLTGTYTYSDSDNDAEG